MQGTLIACSLMIARFESAYTEQNQRRADSRRADLLHGIIASFITLNKNSDGTPNLECAKSPLSGWDGHVSHQLSSDVSEELIMRFGGKDRLLQRDVPVRLNVADYVELCEQILGLVTPSCGLCGSETEIDEAWGTDAGRGVGGKSPGPGLEKTQSSLVDDLDKNVRSMLHSTVYNFVVFAVCCVLWGSLCSLNAGGWYDTSRVAICWMCFALLHLDLQFRCKLWRGWYGWTAFWHFPEDFYRQ